MPSVHQSPAKSENKSPDILSQSVIPPPMAPMASIVEPNDKSVDNEKEIESADKNLAVVGTAVAVPAKVEVVKNNEINPEDFKGGIADSMVQTIKPTKQMNFTESEQKELTHSVGHENDAMKPIGA